MCVELPTKEQKESIQVIVNLKANEEGTFKCHLKCNLCFNRIIVNFFVYVRECVSLLYEQEEILMMSKHDYDKVLFPSYFLSLTLTLTIFFLYIYQRVSTKAIKKED